MMKFKKNDHAHNLLVAVGNWVKANGGEAVVAGGIEIQKWPEDVDFKFRVAVKCTGRQPTIGNT